MVYKGILGFTSVFNGILGFTRVYWGLQGYTGVYNVKKLCVPTSHTT